MLLLKGHKGRVHSLAFTPDGQTLASAGGNSQAIWLWDLRTRKVRTVLRGHLSRVTALAISPDGGLLASGSYYIDNNGGYNYGYKIGERLKIWDLNDVPESLTLQIPDGQFVEPAVENVLFSPDGRTLSMPTGSTFIYPDGNTPSVTIPFFLWHWDVGSWMDARAGARPVAVSSETLLPARQDLPGMVRTRSADADTYVVWSPPGNVRLLHAATGEERPLPGTFAFVRQARCSPDGTTVALVVDRKIALGDTIRAETRAWLRGHTQAINDLAFSPDGLLLATASSDRTVRLWDVSANRERMAFDWHVGKVHSVAFSPDGLTLAAGGDNDIVIWDVDET